MASWWRFVFSFFTLTCIFIAVANWAPLLVASESVISKPLTPDLLRFKSKAIVQVITEKNWRITFKNTWMLLFCALRDEKCKKYLKDWKIFADEAEKRGVYIGFVDVDKSPILRLRFFATLLPSVYYIVEGKVGMCTGYRNMNDLTIFLYNKQFSPEILQLVSDWIKPDSVVMSSLATLFSLSFTIEEFIKMLRKEYSIPSWIGILIVFMGLFILATSFAVLSVCMNFLFSRVKQNFCGSQKKSGYNKNTKKSKKPMVTQLSHIEIGDSFIDEPYNDITYFNIENSNNSNYSTGDDNTSTNETITPSPSASTLRPNELPTNNNDNEKSKTENYVDPNAAGKIADKQKLE